MTVNWRIWKEPQEQGEISYADFAIHPRYGQGPRITGSNPKPDWLSRMLVPSIYERRIPNTAIEADVTRQNFGSVPTTHYFDEKRVCRDCKRKFIFFAEEQRHWYEELGFWIDSDCVRCVECRKIQQGIAKSSARYVELTSVPNRTIEQSLEMVGSCLSLVEAGTFHKGQTAHIRQILNAAVPDWKSDPSFEDTLARIREIESGHENPKPC